jgi:hypothetical protein
VTNYCKFEISHSKISLEIDVQRSSVAVGLFSGALIVCAASGLPTYFLSSEIGYYTPDLSCFQEDFVLPLAKIQQKIKLLLSNHEMYLEAREACMHKSSIYFINNQKLRINKEFIKKILNLTYL